MKRISALGLDVGKRRVGVAGCDGTGLIATGLTTIDRSSFEQDVQQLKKIVAEREVQVLVVGLPYSLDGSMGKTAQYVQQFAERLAASLNLPIEYTDERFTSVEAEEQLKAQKRFNTRNKGLIDRQAATIILQQWLDQQRNPPLPK
ncbi:MAG: Holliday junction resolvase RuvX [Gomphosphaeria aponina SAG 52.96 = DSM 107014]|uniref:Putative pre-16S rRNA nuclease n=1 Tax=Gomphosphaeria aponina SAG 52.96 = DSM 107014 TaxID=1521640 RepID=A0A941GS77_9CHRO|nr:Holliday junction resolvase RuvX [Gomphosphaeria aponina SAG 52.96 = DSM 107014]